MFEAEDLSPVSADRESGGHDDLSTTGCKCQGRSIVGVGAGVGTGGADIVCVCHSSVAQQASASYDVENQLHCTVDEELGVLVPAAASLEPSTDDDDDEESNMCVVGETRHRHRTNPFVQDYRPDPTEAFKECNFTDHQSVNKWYPPYKNRGTFNCPYSLLSAATSRAQQREIVNEWRQLHPGAQKARMEEIFAQQAELEQSRRASQRTSSVAASAEPAHNYNTRHRPPLAPINNNSNVADESSRQPRRRNNTDTESATARPTVRLFAADVLLFSSLFPTVVLHISHYSQ